MCTAGVLALLALKLGILQMPTLPSLPQVRRMLQACAPGLCCGMYSTVLHVLYLWWYTIVVCSPLNCPSRRDPFSTNPQVPGQALLSRQLGKAGEALRERLDDLDDGVEDAAEGLASRVSVKPSKGKQLSYSSPPIVASTASSGSSSRVESVQQAPAPLRVDASTSEPGRSSRQPSLPAIRQQQQDGSADGVARFQGLAEQLGSTAKTLGASALQQGKAAGSAVLQQGQQLRDSEAVQDLSQQTAQAASKAAAGTKQAVSGLWQRGKQGLESAGVVGGAGWQLQNQTEGAQQGGSGAESRGGVVGAGGQLGSSSVLSQQEVDRILDNS